MWGPYFSQLSRVLQLSLYIMVVYLSPKYRQQISKISVHSLLFFAAAYIFFTGEFMGSLKVADAIDTNLELVNSGDIRILLPIFQIYGKRRAFSGPIFTLKSVEHNVGVKEILLTKGEGRVLFIDGGGSMRMALIGDNLCKIAQDSGWAGIVVNGCIRDIDEIYEFCDIGVRALGSHPLKPCKIGISEKHVPLHVGGAMIHDGEWLYADADGILISKTEVSVDATKLTNYFK